MASRAIGWHFFFTVDLQLTPGVTGNPAGLCPDLSPNLSQVHVANTSKGFVLYQRDGWAQQGKTLTELRGRKLMYWSVCLPLK